jgi:ornithine cyclodeaminase/alanine dehydrogenase-like protein (mu-crystallin family)
MGQKREIRILTADDIRRALPMAAAVEVMKEAFDELSAGRVTMPARTHVDVPASGGTALFMPSHASRFGRIGVKVVSVFSRNREQGLPAIQGLVCLLDDETGAPLAVLDGTYLTALRTGAASGAATDLLARAEATTVAILGAGVQGRTQLEAVCAVRPIRTAWVHDVVPEAAEAFREEMSTALSLEVTVAPSSTQAVQGADIVCAATVSSTPVFADADLADGAHVNAVGSYQPEVQEIPAETVLRALVVVDHRQSALGEAGDLIIPIQRGLMKDTDIHAELGEVVSGTVPGRTSASQVTLFKSVGVAVQDLAAASRVLKEAQAHDLGQVARL